MAAKQTEGLGFSFQNFWNEVKRLGIVFTELVKEPLQWFLEKCSNLLQWLQELDPSIQKIAIAILTLAGVIGPVLVGVGSLITGVIAIGSVVGAISSPIIVLIGLLATLGAAFFTLWETSEDFRNAATEIWGDIVQIFWNFIDDLKIVCEELGFIFDDSISSIGDTWKEFCEWCEPAVFAALEGIKQLWKAALGFILIFLQNFSKEFNGDWNDVWGIISAAFAAFVETIKPAFELLGDLLVKTLYTLLGKAKEALIDFSAWLLVEIVNVFVETMLEGGKFLAWIMEQIDILFQFCSTKFDQFCDETLPKIKKFFGDIYDEAEQYLPEFVKVGMNIADGVGNGMEKQMGTMIEKVVPNFFGSLLKESRGMKGIDAHSPSKRFADEVGIWIPAGIALGFEQAMPKAIRDMQSSLDDGMEMLNADDVDVNVDVDVDYGWIDTKLSELTTRVSDAWTTCWTNLKTFFVQLWDEIKVITLYNFTWTHNTLFNWGIEIYKTWTDCWISIEAFFIERWENIKSFFNDIVEWMKSAVTLATASIFTEIYEMLNSITAIYKQIEDQMLEIGRGIVEGVWKGIQSATDMFYWQLSSFFVGIVNQIQQALGIASPSKVFADQVGKWIPQGIAAGFEQGMPAMFKKLQSALDAGMGMLNAGNVNFDYGLAPAKAKSGNTQYADDYSAGQQNTGGNTYIFNSPEPIDAAQARREIEQMSRNMSFGF